MGLGLSEALKDAMLKKNTKEVKFLRNMISELQASKGRSAEELSIKRENEILAKLAKQREESSIAFANNGQVEKSLEELEEMNFIKSFLPMNIDDSELDVMIKEFIDSNFQKDELKTNKSLLGLIIKSMKTKVEDLNRSVDSSLLAEKVKNYIQNA